jgi:two-component system chemotaxis response regulator CheY
MEEIDAGTRALKEMQAIDGKVPICLLSSTGDYLQGATDTSELGLAGVFQKPVDPKILLGHLRAKLKPRGPVS